MGDFVDHPSGSNHREARSALRRAVDSVALAVALLPLLWIEELTGASPLRALAQEPSVDVSSSSTAQSAALAAVGVLLSVFVGLLFFVMWREHRASRARRLRLRDLRGA